MNLLKLYILKRYCWKPWICHTVSHILRQILLLPYGNARTSCYRLLIKLMFVLRGGLTLEEALQMAYDDDLPVNKIYIEPPEDVLTDEDSGEEDGGGLVDNLSKNQLSAQAEVVVYCKDDHDEGTDENYIESTVNDKKNSLSTEELKKIHLTETEWIPGDMEPGSNFFFYRLVMKPLKL